MHLVGLKGQMRRLYDPGQYEFLKPLAATNGFITWAAIALAISQLLFFFNFLWSLKGGAPAGTNPWAAESLEWSAPEHEEMAA